MQEVLAEPSRQTTQRPVFLRRGWPAIRMLAVLAVVGVIVLLGARQMREKFAIVKPIDYIGHADEAAYALMGKSISEGRGINVDYISTFYIPYPRTITHREDHWPPFMGLSIAPCFYFLGISAYVARMPAIFYGSIGLPLAAALLAGALSRRGYVALLAGLLMMAAPEIYLQSMRTLSDVATAMLVAAFCAAVIFARRRPWMHLLAGVFAALAYFSKGSEVLLLGLYPILGLLCCGPSVFRRRWIYAGLATALLIVAPFWWNNWREYGNPLHSTQNYVAAFYGFEEWDSQFYQPHWGKNLPSVSDRWTTHKNYWRMSRGQVVEEVNAMFSGASEYNGRTLQVWSDFGEWGMVLRDALAGNAHSVQPPPRGVRRRRPMKTVATWQAPISEIPALGAVALLIALLAALPVMLEIKAFAWIFRTKSQSGARNLPAPAPTLQVKPPIKPVWMIGPVAALWLVILVHILFLAFFWSVEMRFCFTVLPLLMAMGCTALTRLFEWPLQGLGYAALRIAHWGLKEKSLLKLLPDPLGHWARRALALARTWPVALTLIAATVAFVGRNRVYAMQEHVLVAGGVDGAFPFYNGERSDPHVREGRWIAQHLPDAIVMCRGPWELLFYMGPGNKAVGLPCPRSDGEEGAEEIFAIARYYHVTHMLVDSTRPCLWPYITGRKPGLKRVKGARRLYQLEWNLLPKKTVEDFWGK